MNNSVLPIFIIAVLSLIGTIADYFLKISGQKEKVDLPHFLIACALYFSAIFGWFYVLKYLKLSTIGVYYGIFSILFLVGLGIFTFKEHLNFYEIIGIILAIASMILLSRFA